MTWLVRDWHWLVVAGVWSLVALFAWSLVSVGKTRTPVPDEVAERRRNVRRAQAQIDREKALTGRDVVTDAVERFIASLDPKEDA